MGICNFFFWFNSKTILCAEERAGSGTGLLAMCLKNGVFLSVPASSYPMRPVFPRGLKPLLILLALSARLKPCPFKAKANTEFFHNP